MKLLPTLASLCPSIALSDVVMCMDVEIEAMTMLSSSVPGPTGLKEAGRVNGS